MLYSTEMVMAQSNSRLEEAATRRLRNSAKAERSRRRTDLVLVLQAPRIAAR